MASRHEAERSNAATVVFDNSGTWLIIALLVTFATAYFSRHSAPVYVAALVIAVVALISILFSLRFYSPWFSWLAWFVPLLLFSVVIEPVRIGVISLLTAVFAYALASVCVFGVLFSARNRLKKWVIGAF